jgi:hypothetical protein
MARSATWRRLWNFVQNGRWVDGDATGKSVAKVLGNSTWKNTLGHVENTGSSSSEELRERLATARWHTTRYDSLRASLTTRASFVVSVNAIVIAGVALLLGQSQQGSIEGGRAAFVVLSFSNAATILFSVMSVWRAMGALVGRQQWRTLFGDDPPLSTFYQHSDTFKEFNEYMRFSNTFQAESLQVQLDSATANLWVVMRTHSYRYAFLRKALASLGVSMSIFVTSSVAVLVLKAMKQLT